jgi:hypothetical protein
MPAKPILRTQIDKDVCAPPIDIIRLAVQMMDAPGAPTFPTKREKREATVKLARKIWKSE